MKLILVLVLAVLFALATSLPVERALNDDDCGVAKVSSRIIGGQNAYKGQFPWQTSLLFKNLHHICGATIIDDNWVLCAAHCFMESNKPGDYTVNAAVYSINTSESQGYSHYPTKIYIHESYDNNTYRNDIALLKVSDSFKFHKSKYLNRVCLPSSSNYDVDNKPAIISGWGLTEVGSGKFKPTILQWGETTIGYRSTCDVYGAQYNHNNQLCAKSPTTSACQGDSGGPITVDDNGKAVQVGITSFGPLLCLDAKYPNVYTRVSAYLDWIEEKMGSK